VNHLRRQRRWLSTGGKLSEACAPPPKAARTPGPAQNRTDADVFLHIEKLDRKVDRIGAIVGSLAIVFIDAIAGGLVVLAMTALLSVNQMWSEHARAP
jgi:hypothetical protein